MTKESTGIEAPKGASVRLCFLSRMLVSEPRFVGTRTKTSTQVEMAPCAVSKSSSRPGSSDGDHAGAQVVYLLHDAVLSSRDQAPAGYGKNTLRGEAI